MSGDLKGGLGGLRGVTCTTVDAIELDEPSTKAGDAVTTEVHFADGTRLTAQFWRLIKNRKAVVSIFDHGARYGLPGPVDAIGQLGPELSGRQIVAVTIDRITGDLHVDFAGDVRLEVFNVTAYEIWQLRFPDGTIELSNDAFHQVALRRGCPRSVHVLVGELLSLGNGVPACVEELADLLREDHRFNQWFLALKHGRANLKPGKTGRQLMWDAGVLHETDFRALVDACDAYRGADWPKQPPDTWKQTQDSIRKAVVAYTLRIQELRAAYSAD